MKVVAIPWSLLAAAGTSVALTAGYLVMRGPFFGGELLEPVPLLAMLAAFVLGLVAATLGGSKMARHVVGF